MYDWVLNTLLSIFLPHNIQSIKINELRRVDFIVIKIHKKEPLKFILSRK